MKKKNWLRFDRCFHFGQSVRRDGIHVVGGFCMVGNLFHQLGLGGSRGLKRTVLCNAFEGRHLSTSWDIILNLFIYCSDQRFFSGKYHSHVFKLVEKIPLLEKDVFLFHTAGGPDEKYDQPNYICRSIF